MDQPPSDIPPFHLKRTAVIVVILCIIAVTLFKGTAPRKDGHFSFVVRAATPVTTPILTPKAPLILHENPFNKINLTAKSAYVYDVSTGTILFQSNAQKELPLASLTKIMMAITVLSTTTSPHVTIGKEDLKNDGDNGLRVGEQWNLKDLLRFTLVVSSNDGAHALARTADASGGRSVHFVDMMNQTASALGFSRMYFLNESGLDVSKGVSGGYGTAEQTAKLFGYAVETYPEIFEATKNQTVDFSSTSQIVHHAENTNKIISQIPSVLASKTGLTELAGGNLAIEFTPKTGHPVIVVVMGSTETGRFDDVLTLVHATQKYFENF